MANKYFSFKQFTVYQDKCSFKVGTDGVLLGASAEVNGVKDILDVGTGTGLIALMLAQRSDAHITALEPDEDSFRQAVENIRESRWNDRINVINTRIQLFDPGYRFDLIVSNPPYFTDSLKNPDDRKASARHTGNLTGVELLEGVRRLLTDKGKFQVIMPWAEGNLLIAEASGFGLYCNQILKIRPLPTSGIKRMIITFSTKRESVREKFLTIEHGSRHEFTEDYKNLTKDFYLNF